MAFSPQKFREIVLQMLVAFEMESDDPDCLIELLMDEAEVSRKNVRAAYAKASEIWQVREELDRLIGGISKEYALHRIGTVERAALRQALFGFRDEPKAIVISEAIRLTCKFSTKEAAHFVNAILDAALPSDTALSPSGK